MRWIIVEIFSQSHLKRLEGNDTCHVKFWGNLSTLLFLCFDYITSLE